MRIRGNVTGRDWLKKLHVRKSNARKSRTVRMDAITLRGVGCENSGMAIFFFSSRRRHTIFDCVWSSDVCSSDLGVILDRNGVPLVDNSPGTALELYPSDLPKTWRVRKHELQRLSKIVHVPVREMLRSEEHTSELQSQSNLVCRLLLEKKKINETKLTQRRAKPTLVHRIVILVIERVVLVAHTLFVQSAVTRSIAQY